LSKRKEKKRKEKKRKEKKKEKRSFRSTGKIDTTQNN
jgi:hypothetical protein